MASKKFALEIDAQEIYVNRYIFRKRCKQLYRLKKLWMDMYTAFLVSLYLKLANQILILHSYFLLLYALLIQSKYRIYSDLHITKSRDIVYLTCLLTRMLNWYIIMHIYVFCIFIGLLIKYQACPSHSQSTSRQCTVKT